MSDRQMRRLILYLLTIIIGMAVAGGGVMQAQLANGQPIEAAPILAAVLGVLITGLSGTVLPALRTSAEEEDDDGRLDVDTLLADIDSLTLEERTELIYRLEARGRTRGRG